MNKICKIFIVILSIMLVCTLICLFMSLAHNSFLIELYEDFANSIIIDPNKFFNKLNKILGITIGFEALGLITFIIIGIMTKNSEPVEEEDLISDFAEEFNGEQNNTKLIMEENIMSRKEKRDAKKAGAQVEPKETKVEKKAKKAEETPAVVEAPKPVEAPKKVSDADAFLESLRNRRR